MWEIEAREEIRDTLGRYNAAGDRGNAKLLSEQFLPDGILIEDSSGEFRGREAIEAFIGGVTRGHEPPPPGSRMFIHHHVSSVVISSVTPSRADASSYFAVYTHDGFDHCGRYRDVLVPSDGRWLIERRSVRVDMDVDGSIHRRFAQNTGAAHVGSAHSTSAQGGP